MSIVPSNKTVHILWDEKRGKGDFDIFETDDEVFKVLAQENGRECKCDEPVDGCIYCCVDDDELRERYESRTMMTIRSKRAKTDAIVPTSTAIVPVSTAVVPTSTEIVPVSTSPAISTEVFVLMKDDGECLGI